jgi:hypothetical protein
MKRDVKVQRVLPVASDLLEIDPAEAMRRRLPPCRLRRRLAGTNKHDRPIARVEDRQIQLLDVLEIHQHKAFRHEFLSP